LPHCLQNYSINLNSVRLEFQKSDVNTLQIGRNACYAFQASPRLTQVQVAKRYVDIIQFQDYSLLFSRIDEFSFRPIPRVCPPDIHGNANKKDSNDHGKGCPFEACSRGPRHYRSRTLELAHKLVLALLGRPNHAFVTGGTNLMREIC
jgi:hypothetical protein